MEIHIKNKKSFTDFVGLLFAISVIFGIAIFLLILHSTYNENIKDELNDALTSSTSVDANSNVTKILDQTGVGLGRFNPLFAILVVGIFGFVLVSLLFVKSHPAFLFIGLIVLGVTLTLAAIFSNVYEEIGSTDEFSNSDDSFSVIGIILDNLPLIAIIFFVLIAFILYGMPGKSGGGY